jgi:hypothetical protein
MSRPKQLTYLTQPENDRFMKAATELHPPLLRSLISPSCEPFPSADRIESGNRHGH